MFEQPLEVVVSLVTTIVSFFSGRWVERSRLRQEADQAAYRKLTENLPSNSDVRDFFVDHDFGAPFQREPVYHKLKFAFEDFAGDPAAHFHNKKVQRHAERVAQTLTDFASIVAKDTFPTPDGWQSIRRAKFGASVDDEETAHALNERANDVWHEYQKFVTAAHQAHLTLKPL